MVKSGTIRIIRRWKVGAVDGHSADVARAKLNYKAIAHVASVRIASDEGASRAARPGLGRVLDY